MGCLQVEEPTWECEFEVREKYPDLFVDVWVQVEILVLIMNYKNIVYVLDYGSIVNVEYVLEMQV